MPFYFTLIFVDYFPYSKPLLSKPLYFDMKMCRIIIKFNKELYFNCSCTLWRSVSLFTITNQYLYLLAFLYYCFLFRKIVLSPFSQSLSFCTWQIILYLNDSGVCKQIFFYWNWKCFLTPRNLFSEISFLELVLLVVLHLDLAHRCYFFLQTNIVPLIHFEIYQNLSEVGINHTMLEQSRRIVLSEKLSIRSCESISASLWRFKES